MNQRPTSFTDDVEHGDDGFLLLGALVLIFLMLLALSVAAPRIAKGLQRDKEVESEHRANQYVRGIRMYYKKFGHYPSSVDQLEKTNNQRFLRQRYPDPLTGKPDWRLIRLGENQTKVKGFFGQELQGLQSGLGSAAGMASNLGGTAQPGASAFGSSGTGSGLGAGAGSTSAFGGASGAGAAGAGAGATAGTAAGSASGFGGGAAPGAGTAATANSSSSGADAGATGGLIMGVGSSKSGEAMLVVNEQTTYETWEFLYDPRIEQLYAKGNLLGGGVTSGPSAWNGLGSLNGSQSSGPGGASGAGGGTGQSPGSGGPGTGGLGTGGFGTSGFGTSGAGRPPITPP